MSKGFKKEGSYFYRTQLSATGLSFVVWAISLYLSFLSFPLRGQENLVRMNLELVPSFGVNEAVLGVWIGGAKQESTFFYSGSIEIEAEFDPEEEKFRSLEFVGGSVWVENTGIVFGAPPIYQAVFFENLEGEPRSLFGVSRLGDDGRFDTFQHVVWFNRGLIWSEGFFGFFETFLEESSFPTMSNEGGELRLTPSLEPNRYDVALSLPLTGESFSFDELIQSFITGELLATGVMDLSEEPTGGGFGYELEEEVTSVPEFFRSSFLSGAKPDFDGIAEASLHPSEGGDLAELVDIPEQVSEEESRESSSQESLPVAEKSRASDDGLEYLLLSKEFNSREGATVFEAGAHFIGSLSSYRWLTLTSLLLACAVWFVGKSSTKRG